MTGLRGILSVLVMCWASMSFGLDMPQGAQLTAERTSGLDSYAVPLGPFDADRVPTLVVEGAVSRKAYRLERQGVTSLQLLSPLRQQLETLGYDVLFECDQATCGGFDFRFAIDVLPAPNMSVSLRDYRFITATRGNPEWPDSIATIIVSRTSTASYIQVVEVSVERKVTTGNEPTFIPEPSTTQIIGDLSSEMLRVGHVVLSDLVFPTGSSSLGDGTYASLSELAAFMKENPTARVALVGHTDAIGSLDSNISLSRARAQSVSEVLRKTYDIPASRLEAGGMGYLSPVRSNLTDDGRTSNRRVEAVLLEMP